MKKLLLIPLVLLVMVGCDFDYKTTLKVSEIRNMTEKVQIHPAEIRAEVIECKDDTTGLVSKYVFEAKQHVPYMFKDSKYTGCVDEGMDDFACFDTKFYMYADGKSKYDKGKFKGMSLKDKLSIVRVHTPIKGLDALLIVLSDGMKQRILNVKKSTYRTPSVNFEFILINDTKKALVRHSTGIYKNGDPVQNEWNALQPGEKIRLKLSRISVEFLIKYNHVAIFEITNEDVSTPKNIK